MYSSYDDQSGFAFERLIHGAVFVIAMVTVIGITTFLAKPFDDAKASGIHFTMQNKPYDFARRN